MVADASANPPNAGIGEGQDGQDDLVSAFLLLGRRLRSASSNWEKLGDHLSRPELALLHCVSHAGEARITEIAATVQTHLSVVSRQISDLEAKGYVVRRPDPADRRAGLVAVSDHGAEVLAENQRAFRAYLDRRLDSWEPTKVAEMTRLLRELAELLDNQEPADAHSADSQTANSPRSGQLATTAAR